MNNGSVVSRLIQQIGIAGYRVEETEEHRGLYILHLRRNAQNRSTSCPAGLQQGQEELWRSDRIGKETRGLIYLQLEHLRQVDRSRVTSGLFRRVHLHRNNRFYRLLLKLYGLLHQSRLPEQRDDRNRFRDCIRDPKRMSYVFRIFREKFLSSGVIGVQRIQHPTALADQAKPTFPCDRRSAVLFSTTAL